VEQVWNAAKCARLANFIPDDADHLGVRARRRKIRSA
jgi:hypothetical protein